jgi:hypothetical protein
MGRTTKPFAVYQTDIPATGPHSHEVTRLRGFSQEHDALTYARNRWSRSGETIEVSVVASEPEVHVVRRWLPHACYRTPVALFEARHGRPLTWVVFDGPEVAGRRTVGRVGEAYTCSSERAIAETLDAWFGPIERIVVPYGQTADRVGWREIRVKDGIRTAVGRGGHDCRQMIIGADAPSYAGPPEGAPIPLAVLEPPTAAERAAILGGPSVPAATGTAG